MKGFYTLRWLFLLAFIMIFAMDADAQVSSDEFYPRHVQTQNAGMYVLGSWAVANIAIGAHGWNRFNGEKKYFHQMNLFWNTVNLGIAGFALYNNMRTDPLMFGVEEALGEARKIEKILLINSGLDVAYIGTGFLLRHLSSNSDKRKDLLKGYGNSLILQGSFLLVFDLILYGVLHSSRMDFMEGISFSMGESYWGVSWCYRF
ncbi:DUF6992 family protein [Marinilabilia salmonicolor]|uniref:DUF6992 family protein n=1 Tax=Marinilabilia salmonicolor TaxID=989 RepID=UPI00029A061C|nr:hypothetical protein [Marinilabilia salmonicolor]